MLMKKRKKQLINKHFNKLDFFITKRGMCYVTNTQTPFVATPNQ